MPLSVSNEWSRNAPNMLYFETTMWGNKDKTWKKNELYKEEGVVFNLYKIMLGY